MIRIRVVNKTRDSVLGARVQLADRWWQRGRGYLARPRPEGGEGILLSPCRAVHMVGIPFPLDVIFLHRDGVVAHVYPGLRPGRMTRFHRRAEYALELPVGTIEASGTVVGDRVAWQPANIEMNPVAAPAPSGAGGTG